MSNIETKITSDNTINIKINIDIVISISLFRNMLNVNTFIFQTILLSTNVHKHHD